MHVDQKLAFFALIAPGLFLADNWSIDMEMEHYHEVCGWRYPLRSAEAIILLYDCVEQLLLRPSRGKT
jgi:hypothetical protein